jgi:hypothetical protein
MEEQPESKQKKALVYVQAWIFIKENTALILTLITALGYFYNYAYTLGYFRFFKLNDQYIDIELMDIIRFIPFAFLTTYFIAMFFASLLLPTGPTRKTRIIKFVIVAMGPALFCWGLIRSPSWVFPAMICLILVVCIIGYFSSQKSDDQPETLDKIPATKAYFEGKKARIFSLIVIGIFTCSFFFVIAILFGMVGYNQASCKTEYWRLSTKPNLIIIHQNGKRLICKDYYPKNNLIGDTMIVINIESEKEIKLILTKTGALHAGK